MNWYIVYIFMYMYVYTYIHVLKLIPLVKSKTRGKYNPASTACCPTSSDIKQVLTLRPMRYQL